MIYGEGVRPSLCVMGTGMEEGYGPYSSLHVTSLVDLARSFSAARLVIDVDGLMSVVRSTEDSDVAARFISTIVCFDYNIIIGCRCIIVVVLMFFGNDIDIVHRSS